MQQCAGTARVSPPPCRCQMTRTAITRSTDLRPRFRLPKERNDSLRGGLGHILFRTLERFFPKRRLQADNGARQRRRARNRGPTPGAASICSKSRVRRFARKHLFLRRRTPKLSSGGLQELTFAQAKKAAAVCC